MGEMKKTPEFVPSSVTDGVGCEYIRLTEKSFAVAVYEICKSRRPRWYCLLWRIQETALSFHQELEEYVRNHKLPIIQYDIADRLFPEVAIQCVPLRFGDSQFPFAPESKIRICS